MFDTAEQRFVLPQRFLAGDDAPVRNASIDVLPDLFVELRLAVHFLEHGHVRLDGAHHPGPGGLRDALCQCALAKTVAPLLEAGRCGGPRRDRACEQDAGAEAGSQHGAARRCFPRIRLVHPGSLPLQGEPRQRSICPETLSVAERDVQAHKNVLDRVRQRVIVERADIVLTRKMQADRGAIGAVDPQRAGIAGKADRAAR